MLTSFSTVTITPTGQRGIQLDSKLPVNVSLDVSLEPLGVVVLSSCCLFYRDSSYLSGSLLHPHGFLNEEMRRSINVGAGGIGLRSQNDFIN